MPGERGSSLHQADKLLGAWIAKQVRLWSRTMPRTQSSKADGAVPGWRTSAGWDSGRTTESQH